MSNEGPLPAPITFTNYKGEVFTGGHVFINGSTLPTHSNLPRAEPLVRMPVFKGTLRIHEDPNLKNWLMINRPVRSAAYSEIIRLIHVALKDPEVRASFSLCQPLCPAIYIAVAGEHYPDYRTIAIALIEYAERFPSPLTDDDEQSDPIEDFEELDDDPLANHDPYATGSDEPSLNLTYESDGESDPIEDFEDADRPPYEACHQMKLFLKRYPFSVRTPAMQQSMEQAFELHDQLCHPADFDICLAQKYCYPLQ